jgi:hypothetical protein
MQSLSILIFPKVFFSPLPATSPRAHYLKKLSPLALLPVFLPWLLDRAPICTGGGVPFSAENGMSVFQHEALILQHITACITANLYLFNAPKFSIDIEYACLDSNILIMKDKEGTNPENKPETPLKQASSNTYEILTLACSHGSF